MILSIHCDQINRHIAFETLAKHFRLMAIHLSGEKVVGSQVRDLAHHVSRSRGEITTPRSPTSPPS
jgi:hypothetical protein